MKVTILFISLSIFFYSPISVFGQNSQEELTTWKFYKEVSGLQIFSQEIGCHDTHNGIHEQYIAFQFVNSTIETIEVSWQQELWYNDICITCNKPATSENSYHLIINPGESIEGNCEMNSNPGLKIFTHFIGTSKGSKLTKYEFKNMDVLFK